MPHYMSYVIYICNNSLLAIHCSFSDGFCGGRRLFCGLESLLLVRVSSMRRRGSSLGAEALLWAQKLFYGRRRSSGKKETLPSRSAFGTCAVAKHSLTCRRTMLLTHVYIYIYISAYLHIYVYVYWMAFRA